MRYSTTAIVLAAMSIGEAVAGPTHVHRHKHEKKAAAVEDWTALDWVDMGINWSSAYAAGQASKTAAAASTSTDSSSTAAAVENLAENKVAAYHTTSASVAASTSTSVTTSASSSKSTTKASSTSSASNALESLWDDLVGLANDVTSFGARTTSTGDEIGATGNVGSPEGSNMMKVSSASGYNFTANFINTSGKSMTVVVWNKAAYNTDKTLLANLGSCLAPTHPTLTFALAAGDEQVVAFDEDSLVGWAQACSDITPSGAFATTWGEASFNPGASGYDMSAIVNVGGNDYNMSISSTEAPQCTSDPTQNYWLTDTQPIGDSDGSCYISQDTATLTVKMGGKM
ncbi:hypothetical protein BPAE_0004g01500 [Botrytis paeoniae]|uniref:Allergen Asp f 4 n=1 Tax=Botrytis paeoniae TaxID=278948 RepID=A0A4Z1G988_9HELO|nr:hypothetical protein BPAE_0004g01500 [Botrytis paeoniae]